MDPERVREVWGRAGGTSDETRSVWLRPGVPTFAGVPAARRPEELNGAGAAVLGIPWERASVAGFSASDGPVAIRRAAMDYGPTLSGGALAEVDRDLVAADRLRVVDYGDVPLPGGEVKAMAVAAHERLIDVVAAGAVPLVLGGEHRVAIPALEVISGRLSGKLGIIAFDDRFDLHAEGDDAGDSQWKRAFELGVVEPEAFVQIGLRAAAGSGAEAAVAAALGHRWYTIADVDELGIDVVAQEAVEAATRGTEAVYLSLDVGVLDPGRGGGEPGGLSARELLRALRVASRAPLAGLDVSGVTGEAGSTARTAARAVLEILFGLGLQFPEGQGAVATR